MKLKEKIKAEFNNHKLTRGFLDYDFRTIVFAVVSFIITTGYAAVYAVLGILLPSPWYGVLAVYYVMIAAMRAIIVFDRRGRRRRSGATEYTENVRRARIHVGCGVGISLFTLPLSVTIMLMVSEKATFSHAGLMIYVAAVYTFYKVVMAIRNVVKARKSNDINVRTVRGINLADMLVSVLALQTAMFDSFAPSFDTDVFNAVTGAVVCLSTVVIGAFMISGGRRAITEINYEKNLQKSKETCEK